MVFSKVINILKRKKTSNKPTKVSATTHKALNTLLTFDTTTQAVPPARTVPPSYTYHPTYQHTGGPTTPNPSHLIDDKAGTFLPKYADWKTSMVPADNKPAPFVTAVKPSRSRRRGPTYAVDAKVAAKWAKTKMQCPVADCGYIVEIEQQIDMCKHLDSKHPLEPCSVCGDRAYSFMTPIERRQHFQTRHPVIRRIALAQAQAKNHLRALRITPFRAADGAGLKGGADDNDDDDEDMSREDLIKLAADAVKAKAKKAISTPVPPLANPGGPSTSVGGRTLCPTRHPLPTERPIDIGIFVNRATSQSVGVTGVDVAHHLEIHWRFCDRCGRDHTVLNTEAERNRHDLVCHPGVTEGDIFCAACGNVHGDDDACEGIEGRFCSKCGFGSSKRTVQKHEKHCQGYSGLLCNYCPYCCLYFTAFWSMHVRDNHIRTCPLRPSSSLGMTSLDLYPSYDARDVGNRRKRAAENNDNAGTENTIPPIKRARQTPDSLEDSRMNVNILSPLAAVPIAGGFPMDTSSPVIQTPVGQIQPAQDPASSLSEEIIRDVPISPVLQLNAMMNGDFDIDMTDNRWQPIPHLPMPLRRRSGLQPLPYLLDPNVNNVPRRNDSNNNFSINMTFTAINGLANPMNDCNFGGVDSPADALFSKEEDAKHQSRLQELLSLVSPVDSKFDDDIYSVKLPKDIAGKSLKPPSSSVKPAKITKQTKKAAKKTKARKLADDGDADYVDNGISEDETIVSEAEDHMDIEPVPQVLTKEIPEATITKAPTIKSPVPVPVADSTSVKSPVVQSPVVKSPVAKTPTIVKGTPKPAPKPKASAPKRTRKARAASPISIPSPVPAAAPTTNDTGRRFPSPTWPRSPQNFTPTDNMFCSRCFKRIPKPPSGKLKSSFEPGDPTYAQQMAAHEDLRKGCGIPHRLGTPNLNGVGLPNRSGWIDWSAKYNGKKLPKSARQMSQAFVSKYPKYKHTVFPANGSNATQALWTLDPNHPDWSGDWNLPWPPYESDKPFPVGVDAAPDNGRISADNISKDVASPDQEAEAAIEMFICKGSTESFMPGDNMKKAASSNKGKDSFMVNNEENENFEL